MKPSSLAHNPACPLQRRPRGVHARHRAITLSLAQSGTPVSSRDIDAGVCARCGESPAPYVGYHGLYKERRCLDCALEY
jgi:hypothetical protein